jgi:hypothetical protein
LRRFWAGFETRPYGLLGVGSGGRFANRLLCIVSFGGWVWDEGVAGI